jgi:NAD(P)-dependent dehydrogenase (short-subunit alcohol dehydrogenase family)
MLNKNIEKLFDLKDQVAIITGAAGMLGYQYAEVLSDAGAHVVIIDVIDRVHEVAKTITARNNIKSIGIKTNITSEEDVQKMVDTVMKEFGRIDILVNNAAVKPKNLFNKFEDYSLSDWQDVVDVDLNAVFVCSKIIGKQMLKKNKGVIINIGSTYGVVGTDQGIYGDSGINAPAVYSAAKGGVINLTRYLATYWAGKGIRVNCLSPGGVENNQDPEFIKKYSAKTPLGRMARRDEYKGAVLFLASDASSYMNGSNMIVDGGWTAW